MQIYAEKRARTSGPINAAAATRTATTPSSTHFDSKRAPLIQRIAIGGSQQSVQGPYGAYPGAAHSGAMPPRLAIDFRRVAVEPPGARAQTQLLADAAAGADSAGQSNAIHEAAERGIRDGGGPLPYGDIIQRSFGHHDVGSVRAYIGGQAAAASRAIGARAYAMGNAVAFGSAPDLHTAAHEAAHVVQQRAGVSLMGGVGRAGDPYEQHAEAVAARVVGGRSAEHLLDQRPATGAGGRAVQRFAFLNDAQIGSRTPDLTAAMRRMVSDSKIRQYTTLDEFKKHAQKKTDYLGNLADGTWMRFEPTGMNLLGENHTKVSLEQVLPNVGSTSFIYEPFSSDDMAAGSNIRKSYERENRALFKTFGVGAVKDKKQFGEESLFPKIGFAFTLALPVFQNKAELIKLTDDVTYTGQPIQRYLKIGWAYSKDNKAAVARMRKAGTPVPPTLDALAKVHTEVEAKLEPFIPPLPVDGYIGNAFKDGRHDALLPLIAKFIQAFLDMVLKKVGDEVGTRLSAADQALLNKPGGPTLDEQSGLFMNARDLYFEDNIKAAAKRGVRYAGMGQAHLDTLVAKGLPSDQHPFEMNGKDITAFRALTAALKAKAK